MIAAATAYANYGVSMIPFYIYYSMFGYQRIGDLAWAAGDSRARGFLMGGTAGRTTLEGEGLQHQDGHNLIQFDHVPNCLSYDPTFAYEMAVIIRDGIKRMFNEKEDVYYYITCMNENYSHPAMPEGSEEGILKGLYSFKKSEAKHKNKVHGGAKWYHKQRYRCTYLSTYLHHWLYNIAWISVFLDEFISLEIYPNSQTILRKERARIASSQMQAKLIRSSTLLVILSGTFCSFCPL